MNIGALIIQLVSGALGGNAAGTLLKKLTLGPVGNSIVGILGGGLGGQLLGILGLGGGGVSGGAMDLGSIATSVVSGGVGGGVLLAIVGLIRGMFAKHATEHSD